MLMLRTRSIYQKKSIIFKLEISSYRYFEDIHLNLFSRGSSSNKKITV